MKSTRRQFFSTLFAAAVTAPLVRLGWKKAAPAPAGQLGMSIRTIRHYDPGTGQFMTRMDVIYGWETKFAEGGKKIGDTITVSIPKRFVIRDAAPKFVPFPSDWDAPRFVAVRISS